MSLRNYRRMCDGFQNCLKVSVPIEENDANICDFEAEMVSKFVIRIMSEVRVCFGYIFHIL